MKNISLIITIILLSSNIVFTQGTAPISLEELNEKVSYLASDELKGRMTGSEGIKLAADYITMNFDQNGLMPLPNYDSFLHPFKYVKEVSVKQASGLKLGDKPLALTEDYYPAAFSSSGKIEGEIVFAGYGIKYNESSEFKLDSYSGIDVQDKIVAVFDGYPTNIPEEYKKDMQRYFKPIYKATTAKALGAKGLIILTELPQIEQSINNQDFISNSGIPVIRLDKSNSESLFTLANTNAQEVKSNLSNDNPHILKAFDIPNITINGEIKIEKVYGTDNNIIGYVPAKNSDKYLIIGAHYDHLGYGNINSLASGDMVGEIHNGADDNASGTAMVMELAEFFGAMRFSGAELMKYNLVFVLWSGEEMGLIGSTHFAENLPIEKENIVAYLNFDMVGMLEDKELLIQGIGSSDEWKKIFNEAEISYSKATDEYKLKIKYLEDPYIPTDAMPIYKSGIPVASFFTGLTDYYHKPSDDADKLDYLGMFKIAQFSSNLILLLSSKEYNLQYKKVEMSSNMMSRNRGFKVSLGTIPDYATKDEKGMKISGVREGSPADKAGLESGDIVVKLANTDVNNIYDYTYALGNMEPGKEYELIVLRNEDKLTLSIIPEERKSANGSHSHGK